MVITLDDTKRQAIASKLADMKAIQTLLINNEQYFIKECQDADICERLQDMLDDDQKNLSIIETVIVQYGIPAEPRESIQRIVAEMQHMLEQSEFTLHEKVSQHELLKHKQVMNGLLVHKAGQVVGSDIEAAIAPLNAVNFENRAHQEQLKGILEALGVRELTGQDAKQGLWARVQDAIAALTGVVGSAASHSDLDMRVQDLIRMDHAKAKTLFKQIEQSTDPQKIQEYFGQLYKDLTAHAEAEEEVVYPAVRAFYGNDNTQELYDEQADMKQRLQRLKSLPPNAAEFKAEIQQLKDIVLDHVRQEETTLFVAIRDHVSEPQQENLAHRFQNAKQQIQERLAAQR